MTYRHAEDMGEISGFGGGYEAACQDMLERGVKWLDANPTRRDLRATAFENVTGVLIPESDDCKALSEAIVEGMTAEESPTGAMHEAVMQRLMFIARPGNGWDKYCNECRDAQAKRNDLTIKGKV